jgi:hypothetical protein
VSNLWELPIAVPNGRTGLVGKVPPAAPFRGVY